MIPFLIVLAVFVAVAGAAIGVDAAFGGGVFLFGGQEPGTAESVAMIFAALAVIALALLLIVKLKRR